MRARRWLSLLAACALIFIPASIPASAAANSAFDQYVEVPPDSGSNPGPKDPDETDPPTDGKPGSPADKKPGKHGDAIGSASGESDPMVAWATGQTPGGGPTASDGTQRPNSANGGNAANTLGNQPLEAEGSVAPAALGGGGGPLFLLIAMIATGLLAVIGVSISRKRQLD